MVGVLLDLDGTVLDTLDDLTDAVNHALEQFGYPVRTREEVRCFVGNGAARLMRLAVPQGKPAEPVLEEFQRYYRAHCRGKTAPYAGIPEALAALHVPLAIVSNKPDAAVKALCADFFPGIYAQGEQVGCPRKPAPDMVYAAMKKLGIDACVYVGDSEVDVQTAKNAGVPCISVLWGFRQEAELRAAGGTHFCRTPAQLPGMVEMLLKTLESQKKGIDYGK